MKRALKILIIVVCILAAAAAITAAVYKISVANGKDMLLSDSAKPSPSLDANAETTDGGSSLPADADVYYGGEAYYYRDGLINILFIGVDKYTTSVKAHNYYQADSLYLFTFDDENETISILAIPRGIMTAVEMYDEEGNYSSDAVMQICLSYGYGQDDLTSSRLTVKAVSRLLYDLPILGFYTIFMDEIPSIMDSVGSIEVYIDEDLTDSSPDFTKGSTVVIDSSNVEKFFRARTDSNEGRVRRQMSFITAVKDKLLSSFTSDPTLAVRLYDSLSDSSVTDIGRTSALYLIDSALRYDISAPVYLPSSAKIENGLEAVYPDESGLFTLFLSMFYNKYTQ